MATFNFTFDPGTTVQQMLGFEIAGRVWSRYLTDNVTLNLQVGVSSDLGSNVIGGALPGMRAAQSYNNYRTALNSGPKSAADTTALSALPIGSYSTIAYGTGSSTPAFTAQSTLNMTRAVAKAAGISLTDGSTALDGYVLFSNLSKSTANGQSVSWSYDYTRSKPQASNTLDFLSTAIHELGHVLGFVSGVDQPGWLNQKTTDFGSYILNQISRAQFTNPLDLFRQSNSSQLSGDIDMSTGANGGEKFFSIDQGKTSIAAFSSGIDTTVGGDGYQASHWKNGTTAMMNPTLSLSQRRNIAAIDLQAMDVIGWDIATTGVNTTIDLATLQAQASLSLAIRAAQGLDAINWITKNFTASPTQLVSNRDTLIYTMMQNSVVYDMTRVAAPSSTGWTTRQTLAQVLQQRSLFSTVDELDGFSDAGSSLPQLIDSARAIATPSTSLPTSPESGLPLLSTSAPGVASIQKIARFYLDDLSVRSASPISRNSQNIAPIAASTLSVDSAIAPAAAPSPLARSYDSGIRQHQSVPNSSDRAPGLESEFSNIDSDIKLARNFALN